MKIDNHPNRRAILAAPLALVPLLAMPAFAGVRANDLDGFLASEMMTANGKSYKIISSDTGLNGDQAFHTATVQMTWPAGTRRRMLTVHAHDGDGAFVALKKQLHATFAVI